MEKMTLPKNVEKSKNLATVLTVRLESDRFPQKAIQEINGKPLLYWIIYRLKDLPGSLTVATTTSKENDKIEEIAKNTTRDVNVFRGDVDDVVKRVDDAINVFHPDADFVFRALGDCPFIETSLVKRSLHVMSTTGKEAFLWHLAPETLPVYGAREFPFARSAWNKIVQNSKGDEREHPDKYFHNHRDNFNIVYHEPPPSVYFRPNYRLEVDWKEDLDMIAQVAKDTGMLVSLSSIIRHMDTHSYIARINRNFVEKTGPSVSYEYNKRRVWMKCMSGQPTIGWDDYIWNPPTDKSTPVFCTSGTCFIGYGSGGSLHTKSGDIIVGEAFINCNCKTGKYWKKPK